MFGRCVIGFAACVCGFISLVSVSAQGPDDKGASVFNPLAAPRPTSPASAIPNYVPSAAQPPAPSSTDYLQKIAPDVALTDPGAAAVRRGMQFDEIPDINKDLAVTPSVGNWLIMIISYSGKDGAQQARKMCVELRNKNRVAAYVYVFGAEERRKEQERVKKLVEQQQLFLKQNNMSLDTPVRIRHQQIDVHHAVLIGGYPDDETAKRALESVKKWPQPDEKSVDLEVKYYARGETKGAKKETEAYYVNPFKRAFVCRNPTVKNETQQEQKLDIATLRRMNADEPYSLLNCRKNITLAVKEFQTPYMMQDKTNSTNIFETLGTKTERQDHAKISAHNLAETLRKINLSETYVLHAKFSSTVTVGAFDSVDDPALKSLQEKLAHQFNQPPFTQIQFFYRPVPMVVPR